MKPRSTSVLRSRTWTRSPTSSPSQPRWSLPSTGGASSAHPGALLGGAGHDALEALPDPVLEQQRRSRLAHLTLDLRRVVLLVGAVKRQLVELGERVGGRRSCERRLEHALRDDVGEAPVRRGGVRVVAHGEAEVPDGRGAREIHGVFAGAHQLHDGEREIGEAKRIDGLAPQQERLEGGGVRLGRQLRPELPRQVHDARPALGRSQHAAQRRQPAAIEEARRDPVGRDHQILDQLAARGS